MRRFKNKMDDKETRDEYHEMIREKNALKDRQRRTRRKKDTDMHKSIRRNLKPYLQSWVRRGVLLRRWQSK